MKSIRLCKVKCKLSDLFTLSTQRLLYRRPVCNWPDECVSGEDYRVCQGKTTALEYKASVVDSSGMLGNVPNHLKDILSWQWNNCDWNVELRRAQSRGIFLTIRKTRGLEIKHARRSSSGSRVRASHVSSSKPSNLRRLLSNVCKLKLTSLPVQVSVLGFIKFYFDTDQKYYTGSKSLQQAPPSNNQSRIPPVRGDSIENMLVFVLYKRLS